VSAPRRALGGRAMLPAMTATGRRVFVAAVAVTLVLGACTSADDGGGGDSASGGGGEEGFVDPQVVVERQDEYLGFATEDLDPTNPVNVMAHAERAERDDTYEWDSEAVTPEAFAEMFAEIDAWEDTTDFDVLYLINLWYSYRDQLPADTVEAMEQRFLGFEYWYTEPTPPDVVDNKYYWSENHRLIFHTDEYLAGQAFPDETFTNDGRTGAEHRDEARQRILDWLDEKVRFGFTEWHSDVYYQKDVTPLLSLVELAEDEEVAQRAAMVLDLVLLDIASNLQEGNFGGNRGRSYMKDKSVATDQDTFGLSKLLFDDTDLPYQSGSDAGAMFLARSESYQLPQVIADIAASDETTVATERMGVPLDVASPVEADPEAPYGYDFDDPENVPFWWERGAQTAWQVVPTTIDTLTEYDLWESQFYAPFLPLREVVGDDDAAAQDLAQSLQASLGFGLLTEVDSYTYRSPEVMLSTAQDHRPGVFAQQEHSWQATLDEQAIVFTTQPRNEPEIDDSWSDNDGYWTGTGVTPRSAQHGAAAIHLYAPQYVPGPPLASFGYLDATHAYFPTEHFDEVVGPDASGWTFGRVGDGYVGLYSFRPAEWRPAGQGEFTRELTEDFDLRAEGQDNVWIVQVGDAETSGSFADFQQSLTGAEVAVEELPAEGTPSGGFDVTFTSPTEGEMVFSWTGPLTVDGQEVDLHPGDRYDTPWAQAAFDSQQYEITEGDRSLTLDFETATRETG
jgi:hypothetical protein